MKLDAFGGWELVLRLSVAAGASRRVVWLAAVAAAVLQSSAIRVAHAQPGRDARVVLTAGGPTAAVRAVAFSGDSRYLYTAGADKSVEIWSLPQVAGEAPNLMLTNHARWPIARHDRGQIWSLAVNDARRLIAFGGYGAQQINGDISVANSVHGQQQTILPPARPGEDPQLRMTNGHLQTVSSLSFSPGGELLASISLDGDLRVWTVGTWTSQQALRAGENPTMSSVYVQFISNSQFVASLNTSATVSSPRLLLFTIGPDRRITSQTLASPHTSLITALGRDLKSGRWYSGDANGTFCVWRGSQNLRTTAPLRRMPIRSISSSDAGLVLTLHSPTAAAAGEGTTGEQAYAELQQVADAGSTLIDRREWKLYGETLAAAISANGHYAALTRPGEAAVEVFAVVAPNGQPRPRPLSTSRPTILAGSGATVQRVQFVREPGSLLAISTKADGEWTHGYNLAAAEVVRPGALGPAQPAHPDPGWNVRVSKSIEDADQSVVVRVNGSDRATISLDYQTHGHYAAHGWIFEPGKEVPSAIAIGTVRQNGIFVYDLRQPGQASLVRYYRDHTNAVNSLSQSADGRYLASSSRDQTVRIWNLDGLLTRPASFPRRAAWGGEFVIRNGQLVVTSLLEFGVLKGRGLQDGDRILRVGARQNGRRVESTDPRQMLQILTDLPLTESAAIYPTRAGANVPPFIITPAWEPMTTLFIDRRNEWAAWTPLGYYNASVDGDELFGFQINPEVRGGLPKFSRAEQLREDYERPELLQKLFALGTFTEAAKSVAIVPRNPGIVVSQMPQVQVTSPVDRASFAAGAPVTISADVDLLGQPATGFRVDAWVNGAKLGVPQVTGLGAFRRYTWSVNPSPGEYLALVKVVSLGPALTPGLYADHKISFVVQGQPDVRTIHLLAVGANNYQGNLRLNFCTSDARDFAQLIVDNAGRHYRLGVVKVLVDDSLAGAARFEKTAFQTELKEFGNQLQQSQLKSTDLVMLFVAGHGEAIGKEFYFVPPVGEIKNLAQQAVIQRHSVPWSAFRAFLEEIPDCGKALFLDTCYSGNIARLEAEKARLRPLKNLNTVVFAATSEDQVAREDDINKHGRFTTFLLEGLSGKADGSAVDPNLAGHPPPEPDGHVSLLETVGYVSQRVYEKWQDQQPRYTPVELIRFFNDPLIEVPPSAGSAGGR